jgi:tRNA dimethylallyltransferase
MYTFCMKNTGSHASDQHPTTVQPLLYAIVGPTASGKTELALALAEHFQTDILCVDAMQVYTGLDIGTAKPTPAEQQRVTHHGINLVSPTQNFSAAQFASYAEALLNKHEQANQPLVLCGGTGLYYRALLEGFFATPDPDPNLRSQLRQRAETMGNAALFNELARKDPQTAQTMHPNDVRRVVRALEIIQQTGMPVSQLRAEQQKKSWLARTRFLGILRDKDPLCARIDKRTRWMYDNGLIEETVSLAKLHCTKDNTCLQALGYKECYEHLLGECSLETAIENTIVATRQYAKRQMTWFKRQFPTTWISWPETGNFQEILTISLQLLVNSGNYI